MKSDDYEQSLKLGLIGFGEAGRTLGQHLGRRPDVTVRVYDMFLAQASPPQAMLDVLRNTGITVCDSITALVNGQDVVISLVTPGADETVARDTALAWGQVEGVFLDLNTCPPIIKRRCATYFRDPGKYVDGAILASFQSLGAQVPIVVSGPRAAEVARQLAGVGLDIRSIGDEVGSASAIKMCRSVFMKGVECLFVEALLAADTYGASDEVLASIEQSLTTEPFSDWVRMLVTTHTVHAGRRSEEMREIVSALRDMEVPSTMSQATRDSLARTSDSGVREFYSGEVPSSMHDALTQIARLSAHT